MDRFDHQRLDAVQDEQRRLVAVRIRAAIISEAGEECENLLSRLAGSLLAQPYVCGQDRRP